ncbi:hypothetical protein BGZ94_004549 [Podila epigama]|nr:hypothetical protein BGZ94_004549 [Podila epigama]
MGQQELQDENIINSLNTDMTSAATSSKETSVAEPQSQPSSPSSQDQEQEHTTDTTEPSQNENKTKISDTPIENDDDDGFGDFGTADNTNVFDSNNDDDEFGDFGTTSAVAENGFSNDDDDDGFGDFGEVQAATGDQDDFGDFNDFGTGDGDEDAFGSLEAAPAEVAPPVAAIEEDPVEIAPDFNAVNSRQVENYVVEQLSALYPILKDSSSSTVGESTLLNTDLDDLDASLVLSDQVLWTSLCEQSFQGKNSKTASSAPQFQWKHSQLRQEYYASLGLTVVKETPTTSSTTAATASHSILSPALSSKSKLSSPMIVSTETLAARKPLDLEATRSFCRFTKESLGGYSGDEMKDIIAQLTELTRQASDELTYWLDQREQMIMDSERYNEMIASLVGRAAKLKDAESKQGAKSKRLTRSSFNLK